jgi:signal transduction histidine kinase
VFDSGRFNQSDIEFLAQASAAMATVVENMNLIDGLLSRASDDERRKISRDLHDTTIQPYIGLKLALEALQREAGADHRLGQRLSELTEMTAMTIRDLRGYAASLREAASMPGESLVEAIRRQAERLEQFYGVHVDIRAEISPRLDGRMAAEAFQIVSEGLSNILRHTTAKTARASIRCDESNLLLEIANEAPDGEGGAAGFTPRSINERTQALGGRMFVERGADGYTVVHVTIPL